jgi:hypothetical protein
MAYTVKTTSNFFVTGYLYFLFFWLVFAVYCIGYQLNKLRVYFIRRKRIIDQDAVVRPLPLSHLAKPFNYVIRIPFVTEMIPVKHVIGLFVFIGFNMIFAFLAPFKFTEGMPYTVPAIGQMDRRLAYIGMVNWGFVFFLAQRNTILTRMSGFTFEEMIPYHRWIARIGLCEFLPHFVWRMYV